MLSLVRKARLPASTSLLVDASNLDGDESRWDSSSVLVSTQKGFNFKAKTGSLPSCEAKTVWIVMTVPVEGDFSFFDEARQRFVYCKDRKSPVSLRYHEGKQCSISSRGRRSKREHRNCEIDDAYLQALAASTGLPVWTRDRELARAVERGEKPAPSKELTSLLRQTGVVHLVKTKGRGGRWKEKRAKKRS
jgi:hypothetical protein